MRRLKAIAITPEKVMTNEPEIIRMILDCGWDRMHLRHPLATTDDIRRLIESVPTEYHKRLWLHDHHELSSEYDIGGLQLNHRHPTPPKGYDGALSHSCHSIAEVKAPRNSPLVNVTLSPIFDSVSKQGYKSAFTPEELLTITSADHVIALGGITPETLPMLERYEFEGFAVLGYLFPTDSIDAIKERLIKLQPYICYNS